MTTRGFALLVAVLAVLAAGCGASGGADTDGAGAVTASIGDLDPEPIGPPPSPQLPVTVTSEDGAEVTVTSADRIVAVDQYGTLGETVFALGLGGNLVGRDTATDFPAAADIPNVTPGGHSLNAEAILALRPTVVLTDSSIGPHAVQEQIRAAGIPVVFFDGERTLDTTADMIRDVGSTLGVPEAGDALAERTQQQIDRALAAVPETQDPPTIAFLYQRGAAISMLGGPGSGADDIIRAVGGVDAGTASGLTAAYTPVTAEALIVAAPDVILMMSGGLQSVGGVDGLVQMPGIKQTPAGENRRVIDMDDAVLLSYGPSTGKVIRALTEALYGEQAR
ncbi:heme/hemin ABC transporter substrate-binding protein [Tomitella gaofuii]|uniref:heme/hemin ABC transporter substrate-binding protein n=1 Tax=Tomitella gaofuii TaxID=2760083 RepID=UPI001C70CDF5|nr:ABC transporter substrate-binding protein [Tomitella gaofuii]